MHSRFFLCALVLAALAGCGSPAARLVGKWEVELIAPPADDATIAEKFAYAAAKGSLSLELTPDQRISFQAGGKAIARGTWKLVRQDGEAMILEVKLDNLDAASEDRIVWVDRDRIKWRPPGVSSELLTFKRAKPKTN